MHHLTKSILSGTKVLSYLEDSGDEDDVVQSSDDSTEAQSELANLYLHVNALSNENLEGP